MAIEKRDGKCENSRNVSKLKIYPNKFDEWRLVWNIELSLDGAKAWQSCRSCKILKMSLLSLSEASTKPRTDRRKSEIEKRVATVAKRVRHEGNSPRGTGFAPANADIDEYLATFDAAIEGDASMEIGAR